MDVIVSETVKKHQDALREGNYEEAERIEAEIKVELQQRIDAMGTDVQEAKELPAEKLERGNLTKTYKETIAMYRKTLDLTNEMRVVKKMVRDHMSAKRKHRVPKNAETEA